MSLSLSPFFPTLTSLKKDKQTNRHTDRYKDKQTYRKLINTYRLGYCSVLYCSVQWQYSSPLPKIGTEDKRSFSTSSEKD
jgi:hypothetical protein